MRDEGASSFTDVVKVRDIELPDIGANAEDNLHPEMEPFEIYRDEDIRATAILVEHQPVFPAFAFRFDTADGAVVFSGDTSLSENVARLAKGADVLVHEAIDLEYFKSDESMPPALLEHLRASHADVDGLGALAQRAGSRLWCSIISFQEIRISSRLQNGNAGHSKDSTGRYTLGRTGWLCRSGETEYTQPSVLPWPHGV